MSNTLFPILLLQGLIVIAIAPLLLGLLTKFKCWLQNRSAPSLFQLYFDCYKLLLKQPVVAENASWLFRFAPYCYFACLIVIAFIMPFFFYRGLLTPFFDVIVIVGLFALARIVMALAAMDIGTAFGSLGARRDLFMACLVEPTLLLVLLNLGLITHGLTLGHMSQSLIQHFTFYPGMLFSLCAFVFILLAENNRFPFGNTATHLELTMSHEAMVLEYSGRYLTFIEWGNALKLTLFLLLFVNLFYPLGLALNFTYTHLLIGLVSTLIKLFVCISILAVFEALQAKIRVFRMPEYLAIALFLAVLGILLTQLSGASL